MFPEKLKMIGWMFFLTHINIGRGAYFTMTDIEISIPGKSNLLPSNHPIVTLYAQEDISESDGKHLRYSINGTSGYIRVNATKGDVLFTKNFLEGKGIGGISANISVEDGYGERDLTTILINVSKFPLECDLIAENICYWPKVTYRIMENVNGTVLGPLASAYVFELCSGYHLNYTFLKGTEDFEFVPPSGPDKYWKLMTKRSFNRDKDGYLKNISTLCSLENSQGVIRDIPKTIYIEILDEDNNQPVSQEPDIHIESHSSVFKKGDIITDKKIIFTDLDSMKVNRFKPLIIGSEESSFLEPICNYHPDIRQRNQGTVAYCKLRFTKDKHFTDSHYTVILRLNDTSIRHANVKTSGQVPIHLHFIVPQNLKTYNRPLFMYPDQEVKVFRSAGPLARITQPQPNLLIGTDNFRLHVPDDMKDIFNITYSDGIIFVHDVANLRNFKGEFVSLNITWTRHGKEEFDEIQVRIVQESSKSCYHIGSSIDDWTYCSHIDNANDCLKANVCAIATGGSHSIKNRSNSERCLWRGDRNPGNEVTHLYSTCTPETSTCPDGTCDSLEKLHDKICPQDCTENVLIPTKKKENGRGIDKGNGVCTCDDLAKCQCNPPRRTRRKNKKLTTTTEYPNSTVAVEVVQPNVSRHTGKILGIELSKCGTSCVLGIIAGTLFLGGGVALIVICWRLERVHKAVRGKYSDENQEMTAPLSDYVDRNNQPEPMNLNFNMTTCLTDAVMLNIINKYGSDPKWEFPRAQLIIEQTLGEGEFGRVLRAKALNIAGQKGQTTVAVKTLKEDARESELNDLLSEYQLLKEVSHLNVIRLLGVCTAPGGPIYLIIEFAEYGSLRNYLRRSRHLKSESQKLPSSSNVIEEREIHYDEPNLCKVTPKEILSFAWQISKGMAYLSDIKLVHRDLAARNILLNADKVCKISDFGLTRDVYEDNAYFKRSKGRVPVKWMAPESLSDHLYTSKSDVWSYGIMIWELVTLGATPYPGIAVQNLFHLLKQGYRMERPDNCSPTLYKIMRSCWQEDPEMRPTFQSLEATWEKMLEDGNDYLNLSNNAIHNRSYFISPFEKNEDDLSPTDKNGSNPLNYLSKSTSYEKCGDSDKIIDEENERNTLEINRNNNQLGYETPVKLSSKQTPDNESPQEYTDMQSGKIK